MPTDVTFKTKPELAVEMLEHAWAQGVPMAWVTGDELYGDAPHVRDAISRTGKEYALAVSCHTPVWRKRPPLEEPVADRKDRPRSKPRLAAGAPSWQTVAAVIASQPLDSWQRLIVSEGEKGPLTYDWTRVRIVESRKGLPGPDGWLIARRSSTDLTDIAYYLSNAPQSTSLQTMAEVASARWSIETTIEEGKRETGLDEYEVRYWHSWHRHITLSMMAHAWLASIRQGVGEKSGPGTGRAERPRGAAIAGDRPAAPASLSGPAAGLVSLASSQTTTPDADTSHVKRKYLDIPYADLSPLQKLDVYLPDEGDGPFPVIVSIHGGAFMGCDKADMQVLPMLEGLKQGYAVVAVNYRLSWEAIFPALVHDVKAAVRWIRANAQRYHFDPDRIAAWGGSAGAYLAAMLGTSAGVPELEDLSLGNPEQPSHVQAVVAWFSPTDFSKMDEQLAERGLPPEPGTEHNGANSPESLLLGRQITEIPDQVKAANPETYITPAAPPFFLQHGTVDSTVPVQTSINFAAKLEQTLGKDRVQLELLEGAEHGDPQFETLENVKKVLDFLDKHIK